jgi:MFS transporter, AAHS family, 4-hydroxybenzoate transporter
MGKNMSEAAAVDLNDLIDGQKVQKSSIIFLAISTLAMAADGFDLSAIGFVVPELVKDWAITPAQMAPALTAGIIGLLCGAPLFGYFGDRLGRKKAIVVSLLMYGLLTIVTTAATSLNQFVVLRFLTGIGMGGMIPNILALTAEMAPKRLRGMFTVIVLFGVPAGIAAPGWVTALLVPHYGWPVILWLGGLLPVIIAIIAQFMLPESLKFLVQRGGREDEVSRIVRTLRPDLPFDSTAHLFAGVPSVATDGGSPAKLFMGGLAIITPALWIALLANQFTNFFALSWLPTLLQSAGLSTAQAGISASMFSIGGLAGGFVLLFLIDRFGAIPIVALFVVGGPLVWMMGLPEIPPALLGTIIAGAGFCVVGNNFGINAAMVLIYPTPIRSTGAGLAQAMGRVGSLGAPIIGGILLAMHVPRQELYLAPALSLGLGALASAVLVAMCVRRFGGFQLDEVSAADAAEPSSVAKVAAWGHTASAAEVGRQSLGTPVHAAGTAPAVGQSGG